MEDSRNSYGHALRKNELADEMRDPMNASSSMYKSLTNGDLSSDKHLNGKNSLYDHSSMVLSGTNAVDRTSNNYSSDLNGAPLGM